MGGVVAFFRAVVDFFKFVVVLAKAIFTYLPMFLRSPLKFFKRFILLIVGSGIAFLLMVLYMLISLFITPIAWLLSLWISWWYAVFSTVLACVVWVVYGSVTMAIYTGDFFTGGWLFSQVLCEDDLDAWAHRGNFVHGNKCKRGMLCSRPCGARYRPVFGGLACQRLPGYVPHLCPQQQAYQAYVQSTDAAYADAVASKSSALKPRVFDRILPDAAFSMLNMREKQRYLRNAHGEKVSYLTKCNEGMQVYEKLVRHICANALLLLPEGQTRDAVMRMCSQNYCQYKYASAKLVTRKSNEREGFCSAYGNVQGKQSEVNEERSEDVLQRIFLWLTVTVVLYMVIRSAYVIYTELA